MVRQQQVHSWKQGLGPLSSWAFQLPARPMCQGMTGEQSFLGRRASTALFTENTVLRAPEGEPVPPLAEGFL